MYYNLITFNIPTDVVFPVVNTWLLFICWIFNVALANLIPYSLTMSNMSQYIDSSDILSNLSTWWHLSSFPIWRIFQCRLVALYPWFTILLLGSFFTIILGILFTSLLSWSSYFLYTVSSPLLVYSYISWSIQ